MVNINKLGILLHKTDHNFECEVVLNPGVIKVGDTIHMFYRAVSYFLQTRLPTRFKKIRYCILWHCYHIASVLFTYQTYVDVWGRHCHCLYRIRHFL